VEYTLTPLGHSLVEVLDDIKEWTERHAPDVLSAQQRFDRAQARGKRGHREGAQVAGGSA